MMAHLTTRRMLASGMQTDTEGWFATGDVASIGKQHAAV
jgi:hypothetical protein